MKAKIIFDGKEMEIDITENFSLELKSCLPEEKKKTGYERVLEYETYYIVDETGVVDNDDEYMRPADSDYYENANYYSNRTIAENNARADRLYRQLRRFAVEHREKAIDWNDEEQAKYSIVFNNIKKKIYIEKDWAMHMFKAIYFDSEETAHLAIDTFKDELMWYFTEYKDSL